MEAGDLIRIDIEQRQLNVIGIQGREHSPQEIEGIFAARRKLWKAPPPRFHRGATALYSALAVSAMKGAYMEPPIT